MVSDAASEYDYLSRFVFALLGHSNAPPDSHLVNVASEVHNLVKVASEVHVNSALWYTICVVILGLIVVLVRQSARSDANESEDQSLTAFAPLVVTWIAVSGGLTWVNKLIFTPESAGGLGFPSVALLMLWHMFLTVVFTNIIQCVTPELMPEVANNQITVKMYYKNIAPVGVCLAGSLILSNAAYIYTSVACIQMVKSCTSSIVYMVAVLVGQEILSPPCFVSLLLLCGGVAAASFGDLNFNIIGFSLQLAATCIDAVRLVILKAMVSSNGIKLNAMSGLYYYAPTCFLAILVPFLFHVEEAVPWVKVWALHPVLLASGLIAFALHLTMLLFLRKGSSTACAATGIVKDALLIVSSSVYYAHPVMPVQIVGYCVSLVGLSQFNRAKEANAQRAAQKARQEAVESTPILQKGKHQV